eukprot:m.79853 g.79853  ORF g.79853 m.79853 type:complete len:1226 (+) comp8016_c0_seq2:46-3723(+)
MGTRFPSYDALVAAAEAKSKSVDIKAVPVARLLDVVDKLVVSAEKEELANAEDSFALAMRAVVLFQRVTELPDYKSNKAKYAGSTKQLNRAFGILEKLKPILRAQYSAAAVPAQPSDTLDDLQLPEVPRTTLVPPGTPAVQIDNADAFRKAFAPGTPPTDLAKPAPSSPAAARASHPRAERSMNAPPAADSAEGSAGGRDGAGASSSGSGVSAGDSAHGLSSLDDVHAQLRAALEDPPGPPGLANTELNEAIRAKKAILFLDVRPADSFAESRIQPLIGSAQCKAISVPPALLAPGIGADAIEAKLRDPSKSIFRDRTKFDLVVIIAMVPSDYAADSPASILKDAIYKYEGIRRLPAEPAFLAEGYRAWNSQYPTHCTGRLSRPKAGPVHTSVASYPALRPPAAPTTAPSASGPASSTGPHTGRVPATGGPVETAPAPSNPVAGRAEDNSATANVSGTSETDLMPSAPPSTSAPASSTVTPAHAPLAAATEASAVRPPIRAAGAALVASSMAEIAARDARAAPPPVAPPAADAALRPATHGPTTARPDSKVEPVMARPSRPAPDAPSMQERPGPGVAPQGGTLASGFHAPASTVDTAPPSHVPSYAPPSYQQMTAIPQASHASSLDAGPQQSAFSAPTAMASSASASASAPPASQPPSHLPASHLGSRPPLQQPEQPAARQPVPDRGSAPNALPPPYATASRPPQPAQPAPQPAPQPAQAAPPQRAPPGVPVPPAGHPFPQNYPAPPQGYQTPPYGYPAPPQGHPAPAYRPLQPFPASAASHAPQASVPPYAPHQPTPSRQPTAPPAHAQPAPPSRLPPAPPGQHLSRKLSLPQLTPVAPQAPAPAINRDLKPSNQSQRMTPGFRSARMISMEAAEGSAGKLQCGLRNLGNTCFMNSVLQCLSNTAPLSTYFIQGRYREELNRSNPLGSHGELAEEYAELVLALWCRDFRALSPRYFKNMIAEKAPQFEGSQQHDCQEFCSYLLDGLHEDLNRVRKKPTLPTVDLSTLPTGVAAERAWDLHTKINDSMIVDLFQGQLQSTIECATCHFRSSTYTAFMFLSLPVPSGPGQHTLHDCMRLFCAPERLDSSNRWTCSRCKCPRDATVTTRITRMPPVLLIQLKRFAFDGPFRSKITDMIHYPLNNLDLSAFVSSGAVGGPYSLYGVCQHTGTLTGGHYTAVCRNPYNQRWYHYDDSTVTAVQDARAITSSAYMLFYTSADFRGCLPGF